MTHLRINLKTISVNLGPGTDKLSQVKVGENYPQAKRNTFTFHHVTGNTTDLYKYSISRCRTSYSRRIISCSHRKGPLHRWRQVQVQENGRPPYWNAISGFILTYVYSSACHFTSVASLKRS